MPAISIVIPIHNSEEYIPRFANSLQRQSINDFEAIFVDDASEDASGTMLEALALQDARFRVLRHDHNRGAGVARNSGIRGATGGTLCFADPDDLLPETSLEARLTAYKKHNAIVRGCHMEITDTGTVLNMEQRPAGLPVICRPSVVAPQFGTSPFLCAHWTWLFPTKLVQRHEIFNQEGLCTAEDIIFLIRMFFKIHKMVWIDDVVYRWVKRENSLSNTRYTPRHYSDYFKCVDIFYEESKNNNNVPLADEFCNSYLSCYLAHLMFQVIEGKSSEEEAVTVVHEAARIAAKHGVLRRNMTKMQAAPLQYSGLYRLCKALTASDPAMLGRLIAGNNELVAIYQRATAGTAAQDVSPENGSSEG